MTVLGGREAAASPILTDEDGQESLDLTMGLGSLLLGHGCSAVSDAIADQLRCGWPVGAGRKVVAEWIHWIKALVPCADVVRPTASATEANMLAIRIARAKTNREWIMRFAGHYHGCFDEALAGNDPAGLGLHPLAKSRVLILDEQDDERIEDFIGTGRFAAVMLEPGGGGGGILPYSPDRLRRLRKATIATGTALIFDESMTGFRWAPGGIQEISGVEPDLCVLSKVLTGGLPGGAIAASNIYSADIAADPDLTPHRTLYASTFAGHPLTAAAGCATLGIVSSGEAQNLARRNADAICDLLNEIADTNGLDWQLFATSSVIHHVVGARRRDLIARPSRDVAEFVIANWQRQQRLCSALRRSGILMHPLHMWVSAAHDQRALERLSDAVPTIVASVREVNAGAGIDGSR